MPPTMNPINNNVPKAHRLEGDQNHRHNCLIVFISTTYDYFSEAENVLSINSGALDCGT